MASAKAANPGRSWLRLDGVDLLRGVAIFFVLMNHVNMRLLGAKIPYTRGLPPQLVHLLVWNGQFGVQIFFAISGFLITSTTLRRWGTPSQANIRDFYKLRFARIAPLMFLLLGVLSGLHVAHIQDFVVSQKTGGLGRALFAALTFHINLLEARTDYLPGSWDILWSLSVEEMFYLFFPLACRIFRRTKFFLIPLFIFVVLGPFARSHTFNHNPVWREYSYLGGMDAIALGCLTALMLAGRRLSRPLLLAIASSGITLMIFILAFSIRVNKWGLGRNGLDMTILAVGTCLVITAAAQVQWQAPRFFQPLLLLGKRSYEVYLTHMFVVIVAFHFYTTVERPMWTIPPLFLVIILISGFLGEVTARGYSEPMNRWMRKRWGDGPRKLGAVIESDETKKLEESRISV